MFAVLQVVRILHCWSGDTSERFKAVMTRPLFVTSTVRINCSFYMMLPKYTSKYVLVVVITKSDLYS